MVDDKTRSSSRRDPWVILASLATVASSAAALVFVLSATGALTTVLIGVALALSVLTFVFALRRAPSASPTTSAAGLVHAPDTTGAANAATVKTPARPASTPTNALDHTGLRIGRYTLEERLAVGGMGEVWRASHDTLLRPAALKIIKPQTGKKVPTGERLERFRREAMVTSSLTSPHTVDLFDFGIEGGTLYLAMELLDGMSMRQLVETYGPLEEARVVYLLRQACHSLIEAHEGGIVHRDIKPENILITRAGRDHDFVKVIDFGLVKQLTKGAARGTLSGEDQAPGRELTQMNVRLGTPGYMSPEQIGGDGIDQRADIYALACVAYFALTGQPVFEGTEDSQLMFAHVAVDPEPPSVRLGRPVDPDFEALLLRCLAKNPLARPHTMEALDNALADLHFDPPWTPERARRWWAAAPGPVPKSRTIKVAPVRA